MVLYAGASSDCTGYSAVILFPGGGMIRCDRGLHLLGNFDFIPKGHKFRLSRQAAQLSFNRDGIALLPLF